MPLNRDYIGRKYPIAEPYEVAREIIRRFAAAIGDPNPLYTDRAAAQAAGYDDVVAPPTFLVTLNLRYAGDGPVADPELGLDYSRVVHGEQRFTHHRPVRAGDVLSIVNTVDDIRDAGANELLVTRTVITDAAGEPVADTVSTLVSRGTASGSAA